MDLHYTDNEEKIRKMMEGYLRGGQMGLLTLYDLWERK